MVRVVAGAGVLSSPGHRAAAMASVPMQRAVQPALASERPGPFSSLRHWVLAFSVDCSRPQWCLKQPWTNSLAQGSEHCRPAGATDHDFGKAGGTVAWQLWPTDTRGDTYVHSGKTAAEAVCGRRGEGHKGSARHNVPGRDGGAVMPPSSRARFYVRTGRMPACGVRCARQNIMEVPQLTCLRMREGREGCHRGDSQRETQRHAAWVAGGKPTRRRVGTSVWHVLQCWACSCVLIMCMKR